MAPLTQIGVVPEKNMIKKLYVESGNAFHHKLDLVSDNLANTKQ